MWNQNSKNQNFIKIKVIETTFNSTITNTINRTRTFQNCVVLNSVNFEDDKMSINKLRKTICTCLNGPHNFLPEVSEEACHILCENYVQTAFFQK